MVPEAARDRGDPATLEAAIAAYLAACDVEGKSPRTVQAYRETLGRFHGICVADGLPDQVTAFRPADVYRFMKTIADAGVSLGTRHRRFRETRAFFSWCLRMGYCERHPFAGIPNVKVEQKVIQPLTEAEIRALLDLCDPAAEFGCRNRTIILIFLDTGMRLAELHQLTLANVSWEDRRIHIRHGKGRKQRVVPFGDGPDAALRAYRDRFRGEDAGPLFLTIARPNKRRGPMNPSPLGHALRPAGCARRRAREPAPLSPHLRHLGDREPCPGAGRPVPAGPLHLGDGPSLLRHLRRREGGRRARGLQPRGPPARCCSAADSRGCSVKHRLPKQRVAGSTPVSRSIFPLPQPGKATRESLASRRRNLAF